MEFFVRSSKSVTYGVKEAKLLEVAFHFSLNDFYVVLFCVV